MKELLKYSKNLEIDFPTKDKAYQSKIELGVSCLNSNDLSKSKEMFDKAVELDSSIPSGWIGKAFSEIALSNEDNFNKLDINEYLTRALKSNNKAIVNYRVAIAGCLAFRHASIIKSNVIKVEKYLEEVEKQKKKKQAAVTTAVVGAMFTGKEKSITSNVIGGSLLAGGTGAAYQADLKGKEYKLVADSMFSAALGQTFLSAPILYLCGSLKNHIKDDDLKNNFNIVIDSWKDSVLYLFKKQKEQLVKKMKTLKFSDANTVEGLLNDPNSVQEIGEFSVFMKIIGLSNHPAFNKIENIFKVELSKIFESNQSKQNLKNAKSNQNFAITLGSVLFVVAIIITFIGDGSDTYTNISFGVDLLAIILGVSIYRGSVTGEMKSFTNLFNNLISEIDSLNIIKDDINLDLIKPQNDKENNNSLDS